MNLDTQQSNFNCGIN